MTKPTIIIVPGAWQKPSAFVNIVKVLQDAGYPTVHVPLPTVGGTELPLAGLSHDVEAVRRVLVPIVEEGKEVVVIGHSAGGISMSGAVEGYDVASRKAAGKDGGVVQCIFMTAFVLPKGQSLLGMLGGQPLPWMVVEVSRGHNILWDMLRHQAGTDMILGRPCNWKPRIASSGWLQRSLSRGADKVGSRNGPYLGSPLCNPSAVRAVGQRHTLLIHLSY